MKRIDLTETEKQVISQTKTNISQSHKRNIHMNARKKARHMLENLKFLAENLPESQQEQIFTSKDMTALIETILKYRQNPKNPTKISRIRGSKYQHPTELDAIYLHQEFVTNPKPGSTQKKIPRDMITFMKNTSSNKKIGVNKKFIGIGGPIIPHPSLYRQLNLAKELVNTIYDQIIEKADPNNYRRKLIRDNFPVIQYDSNIKFHMKKGWVKKNIEESLEEDWSKTQINNSLKKINAENKKNKTSLTQEQITFLIKKWLLNYSRNAKIKENQKIIVINN